MASKLEIKSGDKYGRLTIINELEKYISPKGHPQRIFLCECECGNEKVIRIGSLRNCKTISCGCYRKEVVIKTNVETKKTHGKYNHYLYRTWNDMKQRCNNTKSKRYSDYGGRGIKVCQRWLESFTNFLEDMGERPTGMSIDRINNDGNYEPSNCRWATPLQQTNNRRTTKKKEVTLELRMQKQQ